MKNLTRVALSFSLICGLILSTGCSGKNEAVALLNAAGPAVAEVVKALDPSNVTLATKIQTDFAAASSAVASFNSGTSCQDAVSALNIVSSDLNLIPVGNYGAVIAVAIAGVDSVLAVFPACQVVNAPAAAPAARPMIVKAVTMPPALVTAKQFKAQWNQQVAQHAELNKAAIK